MDLSWDSLSVALSTSLLLVLLTTFWMLRPRGPKGVPGLSRLLSLPFVGHQWLLGVDAQREVLRLRQRLGDVFRCDIGPLPTLIMADFKMVKRVASMDGALGRPQVMFEPHRLMNGISSSGSLCGVYLNDGSSWREQRSFMGRHLYSSSGTEVYEMAIDEFVKELMELIDKKPRVEDPIGEWSSLLNNLLWRTVVGRDLSFRENEAKMSQFVASQNAMNSSVSSSSWLSKLQMSLPFMTPVARFMSWPNVIDLKEPVEEVIKHELKLLNDNDDRIKGSYVTMALHKLNRTTATNDGLDGSNEDYRHILANLLSILPSAPEVFGIVEWVFYFLARHQQLQQRLHDELESAVKDDQGLIKWSQRHQLPFTLAFIEECKRLAHFFPLSLPRMSERDIVIEVDESEEKTSITIPKGTQLIFLNRFIQTDPKHYSQPFKFNPERHLKPGGAFVSDDRVLVCGIGKRKCLGDIVAKTMVFNSVVNVVNNYHIANVNDNVDKESDNEYNDDLGNYVVGGLYRPKLSSAFVFDRRATNDNSAP